MRLIDGDALERSIRDYADRKCTNGEVELANGILKALSCVRKAPTIDPVKRGRWERVVNAYGELEGFMCECGCQSASAPNFCPSCGCDMRGDS